jgi:hypothetical protein
LISSRVKLFKATPYFTLVATIKEAYHPNAYLHGVKSVKSGLAARTKILNLLDTQPMSAGNAAHNTNLSYGVVWYHLRLLETEGTVCRHGERPCVWSSTGLGQKRL